ncbi:MAG: Uma2 family endonuclease [Chloroflexi bacterium]|nr:MAG: Uma2 family endonuclease [Chloroflexota bacterium]
MVVQVERRLFTVDEYHQMAEAGIFTEDDRVELIEGEIVEMAPIGSRHAACVDRLNRLFSNRIGERAIARVQSPVRLSEFSEPEPDLALLRPRPDFYAQAHPQPEDVLLVVEVAETSVTSDRDVKVPLYARAGIPEVWLVDLAEETVEVYREPLPRGYAKIRRVWRGDELAPHAFPDRVFTADEILG